MYMVVHYCTKGERVPYVIIVDTQLVVYQMCIFHGMLDFALNIFIFLLLLECFISDNKYRVMLLLYEKWHFPQNHKPMQVFEHLVLDEPIISKIYLPQFLVKINFVWYYKHVNRCHLWQKIWAEFRQGVLSNNLSYEKFTGLKWQRAMSFASWFLIVPQFR